jgi:proteasome lid subunit RPN8/RPN11
MDLTPVKVSREVLANVYNEIGRHPAERGGLLLCDPEVVIRIFVYDEQATTTGVTYTPSESLRQHARTYNRSLKVCGIVHSHPAGWERRLSAPDVDMGKKFFQSNQKLQKIYLPIVQTEPNSSSFGIQFFKFERINSTIEYAPIGYEEVPDIIQGMLGAFD